jgi:integrase
MTLVNLEWTRRFLDLETAPKRRTRLTESAAQKLVDSVPKETLKAYTREWKKFLRWCAVNDVPPLPTTSDDLANWVAERCDAGHSLSIMEQGIAAVVFFHDQYGVDEKEMPNRDDAWRIIGGHRRKLIESGWRRDEAATYTIEQLRAMSATIDDSVVGIRDRAGLLVATGAFARRSQLVGLDIGDVRFTRGKAVLYIAKSKEDQQARGRSLVIDSGAHPMSDAVQALRRWVILLESRGIRKGPLFRRMVSTGVTHKVLDYRLDGAWLGRVVKNAAMEAGISAPSGRRYRAHSTRASGATMAFRAKKPTVMIAQHGGWSLKGTQVHLYNRPEEQESVTDGLM